MWAFQPSATLLSETFLTCFCEADGKLPSELLWFLLFCFWFRPLSSKKTKNNNKKKKQHCFGCTHAKLRRLCTNNKTYCVWAALHLKFWDKNRKELTIYLYCSVLPVTGQKEEKNRQIQFNFGTCMHWLKSFRDSLCYRGSRRSLSTSCVSRSIKFIVLFVSISFHIILPQTDSI